MKFLGIIGGILLVLLLIAVILGSVLGLGFFGVFYTETVGAAQQDADRRVFEHTRSYVLGKTQELAKIKAEYDQAEPDDQIALRAVIQQRFADVDANDMPPGLDTFLRVTRGY